MSVTYTTAALATRLSAVTKQSVRYSMETAAIYNDRAAFEAMVIQYEEGSVAKKSARKAEIKAEKLARAEEAELAGADALYFN